MHQTGLKDCDWCDTCVKDWQPNEPSLKVRLKYVLWARHLGQYQAMTSQTLSSDLPAKFENHFTCLGAFELFALFCNLCWLKNVKALKWKYFCTWKYHLRVQQLMHQVIFYGASLLGLAVVLISFFSYAFNSPAFSLFIWNKCVYDLWFWLTLFIK